LTEEALLRLVVALFGTHVRSVEALQDYNTTQRTFLPILSVSIILKPYLMKPAFLWRITAATVALFALAVGRAQAQMPEPIGDFASLSTVATNEWVLNAKNAQVRLQIITPTIVRFRYSKNDTWDSLSYAIVGGPIATKADAKEERESIIFTTDSLKIVVAKYPLRFSIQTLTGQPIVEDDAGLGTVWNGEQVTTHKKLQKEERFIGLGEKTGPLNRKGESYVNWNTDAFGYGAGQDPIYQTTPFYIGLHDGLQYGLFMDNSYRSQFAFGASSDRFSSFTIDGGQMDYYVIYRKSVADIIKDYTYLTGRMPMPPLWGLGLQQARYSYYPEAEVRTLAKTFRDKKIPADAIVLDIHYMDKYKIFTWDENRFPNPKKMVADLKTEGFRTVTIHDPGIKVEPGYKAYDEGTVLDLWAKYPDGKPHMSSVWPGKCVFPDFTMQKTRDWWKESLKYAYTDNGVEGFWNDMNEPATWGNHFPDAVQFSFEGKGGSHRRAHNIYGLQMSKASYEAGRSLLNKRPFILTRAGYSGIQRYAAVWTGDNRSEDSHMMSGVRLMNSMGLSGIAYTGMDVGGFTGNPSSALFGRWVSISSFSPFFRIHSAVNTKEADAWSFGEEIEAVNKNYINLRYRLLPYMYSNFYEAHSSGLPINRSLAIAYPHDAKVYDNAYQNQFYSGPSILVCPSESSKEYTKVYVPEVPHYDLYTDKEYSVGEHVVESPVSRLPVFVRAGGILVMQSLVQHTGEKPSDTLYVHVYQGTKGSSFTYYEDDGETLENERNGFYRRVITFAPDKRTVTFNQAEGNFATKFKQVKVLFHGNAGVAKGKSEHYAFIDAMPFFDPQGTPVAGPYAAVKSMVIPMPPAGKTDLKY
jgi:alpha-glucosidase